MHLFTHKEGDTMTVTPMKYASCSKHNRNVMYLMVIISFTGNYNGVYSYVMDSIGVMLNLIVNIPKTQ